jgi:hypothetical protein
MTHKILAALGSSLVVVGLCDLASGYHPMSENQLKRIEAGKTWPAMYCQETQSSYLALDCNCYNQAVPPAQDYWMCGDIAIANEECWGPALTNCTPRPDYECDGFYTPTNSKCEPIAVGVESCLGRSNRCITTK